MERTNAGNRTSNKMFSILGLAALLFGIAWTFAGKKVAASRFGGFRGEDTAQATSVFPAPGTYEIDPVHTFVYFSAWHHIVGVVRGRFENTTGTITVAQDPAACAVNVVIDAYSLSTQFTERDDDLRSPAFFDARKFPTITYQGKGIRRDGDQWIVDGSLTIRGVSKVVPLTFTFKGLFPDTKPGRPARAAFHATAETNRGDFGMTRDNAMELGVPPTPGKDVEIQLDIEADAQTPKK